MTINETSIKPATTTILIVGAGPAGVSCAIWLQQLGYRAVLIDKHTQCGGLQLQNPWTNTWIATSANASGADVAQALHYNALRQGCELHLGQTAVQAQRTNEGWQAALSSGQVLEGRFLVLAGGVVPRTGGLLTRGSMLIGPGRVISESNFEGKSVAILGGGDNAFENYQFIKKRGAKAVHIYARTLRARAELLEAVPPEHVTEGAYTLREEASSVNGVGYDRIVVLYGYETNRASLLGLEPLMRPDGFVATDEQCRTSLHGVWAIGELAQRAHPCCVTAMADGVVAAKSIQRELEASKTARYRGMLRRTGSLLSKLASGS